MWIDCLPCGLLSDNYVFDYQNTGTYCYVHRNTFLICNQKTINQPFTVQNLLRSMPLTQWTMNFCKNNEFIFAISCKTSRNKRASNQNSDFYRLLRIRSMYYLFNQLYSIVNKKDFLKINNL